eukprot:TRINITY_DN451_c0_g1_i4.p1 TRINITY_DN451_c0_g1~~TRINITY_DN451_c0_g1_i4.p1  ORF type:complete len:257 (-),score=58.32 TRINITY_DN451_c0_g1_i4:271-1041(-)
MASIKLLRRSVIAPIRTETNAYNLTEGLQQSRGLIGRRLTKRSLSWHIITMMSPSPSIESPVRDDSPSITMFKGAALCSNDMSGASILFSLALILAIPQPAQAVEISASNFAALVAQAALSMVPVVLSGAAAYFGAQVNATNLEKALQEKFAGRILDALKTLPLDPKQKETFALVVSSVFQEEIALDRFKKAMMKLAKDELLLPALKAEADKYLDPKFDKLQQEVKAVDIRLTKLENQLVRIEGQLAIALAALPKK